MNVATRAGVRAICLSAVITCLASASAEAGLLVTYEAPGVQSSQVGGTLVTENFDSFTVGDYGTLATAVGTFELVPGQGVSIDAANQFGGAGGVGNFLAVGVQSTTNAATLNLALGTPQSYFGFWWSAADPQNQISFYSGGSLLATFNPTTALGALSDAAFFGNPNANFLGQNSSEKYAYLNFFGTDGTTFDQIVFANNNLGSGFEIDNISIRAAAVIDPPGEEIPGGVTPVPEPTTLASAGMAILIGLAYSRRRLRDAA